MSRILVTGSRHWKWREKVEYELMRTVAQLNDGDVTIVHGGCPSGADRIADDWVRNAFPRGPVKLEVHKADWRRSGRKAGPLRNKEMVEVGSDVCLAFLTPESVGGSMTADMAEKAGIEVRRFYES